MTRIRAAIFLAAVLALSLSLVGAALAEGSDSGHGNRSDDKSEQRRHDGDRDDAHRQHRGLQGYVLSTTDTSFILDRKQVDSDTSDNVTVLVNSTTHFRIPGGKQVQGIITGPQNLMAGDNVAVVGIWNDAAKTQLTAERVTLTGKTIKHFGGTLTAVSADSITVQSDKVPSDSKTFSLTGAVIRPDGATLAVNEKVKVVYRKDLTTALAVVVKQDDQESHASSDGRKHHDEDDD